MATQCPVCKVDVMLAQVSLHFNVGDEWPEVPVIAGICPECGHMDLQMATPRQFKQMLDDSQKTKAAAAGEQWSKTQTGPQGGDIPRNPRK